MFGSLVSAHSLLICNETISPCGGGCNITDFSTAQVGTYGLFEYYGSGDVYLWSFADPLSDIGDNVGDITGWDTSCITDMALTFAMGNLCWDYDEMGRCNFNQDISGWDTSGVVNMSQMFYGDCTFNQDISGWDFSSVKDMSYMFHTDYPQYPCPSLSIVNYDKLLNSLASQDLQYGVHFDAWSKYSCAAVASRNVLIDTYGWVITDKGLNETECVSSSDLCYINSPLSWLICNGLLVWIIAFFVVVICLAWVWSVFKR